MTGTKKMPNFDYRVVTWQDVLVEWGILTTHLKWARTFAKNVLVTLKDYVLRRSKLFSAEWVTTSTASPLLQGELGVMYGVRFVESAGRKCKTRKKRAARRKKC